MTKVEWLFLNKNKLNNNITLLSGVKWQTGLFTCTNVDWTMAHADRSVVDGGGAACHLARAHKCVQLVVDAVIACPFLFDALAQRVIVVDETVASLHEAIERQAQVTHLLRVDRQVSLMCRLPWCWSLSFSLSSPQCVWSVPMFLLRCQQHGRQTSWEWCHLLARRRRWRLRYETKPVLRDTTWRSNDACKTWGECSRSATWTRNGYESKLLESELTTHGIGNKTGYKLKAVELCEGFMFLYYRSYIN